MPYSSPWEFHCNTSLFIINYTCNKIVYVTDPRAVRNGSAAESSVITSCSVNMHRLWENSEVITDLKTVCFVLISLSFVRGWGYNLPSSSMSIVDTAALEGTRSHRRLSFFLEFPSPFPALRFLPYLPPLTVNDVNWDICQCVLG